MESVYYIGLDVHKKTISYCVKDTSGQVLQEGKIGAARGELDGWMKTLPQPWSVAMDATIFTGWIYDHLLPHAALTWALEMGEVSRFPSIKQAISYCGLCGDEKSSAGKVIRMLQTAQQTYPTCTSGSREAGAQREP